MGVLLWPFALLFALYALTADRLRLRQPANALVLDVPTWPGQGMGMRGGMGMGMPGFSTSLDALRTAPDFDRAFLEQMIAHHGGALVMAHDALRKSNNPTIRRLACEIIVTQRREIIELRRMVRHDGLNKPEYHQFDALFSLGRLR